MLAAWHFTHFLHLPEMWDLTRANPGLSRLARRQLQRRVAQAKIITLLLSLLKMFLCGHIAG